MPKPSPARALHTADAKTLRGVLASLHVDITHSKALEAVARLSGHADFNGLSAATASQAKPGVTARQEPGVAAILLESGFFDEEEGAGESPTMLHVKEFTQVSGQVTISRVDMAIHIEKNGAELDSRRIGEDPNERADAAHALVAMLRHGTYRRMAEDLARTTFGQEEQRSHAAVVAAFALATGCQLAPPKAFVALCEANPDATIADLALRAIPTPATRIVADDGDELLTRSGDFTDADGEEIDATDQIAWEAGIEKVRAKTPVPERPTSARTWLALAKDCQTFAEDYFSDFDVCPSSIEIEGQVALIGWDT